MRDLGYVCLRCRVGQLIACDARRIRRPGGPSSFSTSSNANPTQLERRPDQPAPGQPVSKFRRRPQTGPGETNSRAYHQPSDRSDSLIALFHSVVDNQPRQRAPPTSHPPYGDEPSPSTVGPPADAEPGVMELWQALYKMQGLLTRGKTAEETWAFFEESFYPLIVGMGGGKAVPKIILRRLSATFFNQIAEEKAKDFTCPSLPSLELMTHRMAELGAIWPWTPMMLKLVDAIRKINTSPDGYPSPEDHKAATARREALVRDLQLAWNAFHVQGAFTGTPPPKQNPDNSQKAFAHAFSALFPSYDKGLMYRPMWVALATYGLLTDPTLEFGANESKFVVMMRALIEGNALPFAEDHQTFAKLCPTDLYAYILVRLWVGTRSEASRQGIRGRRKSTSALKDSGQTTQLSKPYPGARLINLRQTSQLDQTTQLSRERRESFGRASQPYQATQLVREGFGASGHTPQNTTRFTWENYGARINQSTQSTMFEVASLRQALKGDENQPGELTLESQQHPTTPLDRSGKSDETSQSDPKLNSTQSEHADQPSSGGPSVEADEPAQAPQPEETRPREETETQPQQISQATPEGEPRSLDTKETTTSSQQIEADGGQPGQDPQTIQPDQDESGQVSGRRPAQPESLQSQEAPENQSTQIGDVSQDATAAVADLRQSAQEAQETKKGHFAPQSEPNPSTEASQPAQAVVPVSTTVETTPVPEPARTYQASQVGKVLPARRENRMARDGKRRQTIQRLDASENTFEHLSSRIHKKIGQSIKQRNSTLLDLTWNEFWGEEAEPSAAQIKKLGGMIELFDYFIIGYASLRKPNRAIFVWNAMLQVGLKPTIKTWTAMIQGCTKANNPEGIKLIWRRLLASGIKLDTQIWTARISGLITSGDTAAAMNALNEMSDLWKARDLPENANIAVEPTIEPVNAALASLLRRDRTATAESLLHWAARQNIQPDIFTFNTLLRPLVREGNLTEMNRIFDLMAQVGVRADIATYTILLDGALADVSSMTPEEQTAAVNRVIGQMEKAGVEANMMAYAKMIYNLLQYNNQNAAAAVDAVLAHIRDRGLELTSHIYTLLAEHYFSRDPPDAAAVTHLIASRGLAHSPNIDRVFWERVIKGYCQAGEVQRAVKIFGHVCSMGSTMTFSTLFEFLDALATHGMMDEARQVVEMAGRMNAAEEWDEKSAQRPVRFWKHRFWHRAEAYGLLGEGLLEEYLEGSSGRGVRR